MNVFRSGLGAKLALVLAFPLGGISPAAAVPLDAPACEQLQTQLDTLRNEGAAADMARGPEWARANLPLARLQRIETLLEVEEQLNFRCGKARITLPTTIEGGEEEIPAPGEATVEGSAGGVALPQRAPAAQKRPAAAAATVTVPKAPAPKAPVAKAPATKPAAAKEAEKKAAPPQKASVKAAKPSVEATEPKKAPAKKKQQPKADDAYRPAPRPPQASESGGAALAPRQ